MAFGFPFMLSISGIEPSRNLSRIDASAIDGGEFCREIDLMRGRPLAMIAEQSQTGARANRETMRAG